MTGERRVTCPPSTSSVDSAPLELAAVYQHAVPLCVTSSSGWKFVPTGLPRVQAPVAALEEAASWAHPELASNESLRRTVGVPMSRRIVLASIGHVMPCALTARPRMIGAPQGTELAMAMR